MDLFKLPFTTPQAMMNVFKFGIPKTSAANKFFITQNGAKLPH